MKSIFLGAGGGELVPGEEPQCLTVLLCPQALHYMLLVSEVEETEIFKICLEYWNHLAAELYRESPFSTSSTPLLSDVPPRRHLYLPVLSQVSTHTHTHASPQFCC